MASKATTSQTHHSTSLYITPLNSTSLHTTPHHSKSLHITPYHSTSFHITTHHTQHHRYRLLPKAKLQNAQSQINRELPPITESLHNIQEENIYTMPIQNYHVGKHKKMIHVAYNAITRPIVHTRIYLHYMVVVVSTTSLDPCLWGGGCPFIPLLVHQPVYLTIWPAAPLLQRGLSTNPWVTVWCLCGCN